jgi:hypothetical protein
MTPETRTRLQALAALCRQIAGQAPEDIRAEIARGYDGQWAAKSAGTWALQALALKAVLAETPASPSRVLALDPAEIRHRFDEWCQATEFSRTTTRPVDAGEQMAMRDAHDLLVVALGVEGRRVFLNGQDITEHCTWFDINRGEAEVMLGERMRLTGQIEVRA